MLPLLHPRLWVSVGVLLVAGVMAGSLAPADYVDDVMVWGDKISHALAYTALTLWFAGIFPRSRYGVVFLALFMVGVLIEVLQSVMSFGRRGDFEDLIANGSGILFGWVLAALGLGGWAQWIEARIWPRGDS